MGSGGQNHRNRPPEPAGNPRFGEYPLGKHIDLLKHESSIPIQMRTGEIGPSAFPSQRKVPDITSPQRSCSQALETVFRFQSAARERKLDVGYQ